MVDLTFILRYNIRLLKMLNRLFSIMKTIMATKKNVTPKWYIVDVSDKILGRIACKIANTLRGKNKTSYTPHENVGDYVIVVNANLVKVSGNKAADKMYYRHSGYIGGLKTEPFHKLQKRKSEVIIQHAVKGMLPKGSLGRQMYSRLKVYSSAVHPHGAQSPEVLQ
jgi:large subunit ribosomal protein L13